MNGHSVTFYRDDTYGGFAVLESKGARLITTMDFGLCESDLDALLGVLEHYAVPRITGDGLCEWDVKAHPMVVASAVCGAMRRLGYADDPLGEKAILRQAPTDDPPDLPAADLMEVRRPVRVGLLSLARLVEKAAGLGESQLAVGFYPRPHTKDVFGSPLPFLRVQVEGLGDAAATQQAVRQALSQQEGVVRLTARRVEDGRVSVESGFALPRTTLESYERRALPTFSDPGKGLAREARYALSCPLPEDVADDLRRRVLESGCGISVAVTERTVKALIPCTQIQTLDLSRRISWISEQLLEWGGDLAEVGEIQEAVAVNCQEG